MLSALPLKYLTLILAIGHRIGQAMGILLGHLSSMVCLRKLTLMEDDLPDKAFCILASRG
jgi:hypothetical protein